MDSLNLSETERIKADSIKYLTNLQKNHEDEYFELRESTRNWIDLAISINGMIHQNTFSDFINRNKRSLGSGRLMVDKYLNTIMGMIDLLEKSKISTNEEIILKRQTNYPITNKYVFTSVSDREDLESNLIFGDKTYFIKIPKGIPIFYISAFDEHAGMLREETEEEFILYPGRTILDENNLLVYQPIMIDSNQLRDYFLSYF